MVRRRLNKIPKIAKRLSLALLLSAASFVNAPSASAVLYDGWNYTVDLVGTDVSGVYATNELIFRDLSLHLINYSGGSSSQTLSHDYAMRFTADPGYIFTGLSMQADGRVRSSEYSASQWDSIGPVTFTVSGAFSPMVGGALTAGGNQVLYSSWNYGNAGVFRANTSVYGNTFDLAMNSTIFLDGGGDAMIGTYLITPELVPGSAPSGPASVPEPSTLLLLGSGLSGLALLRRIKK